MIRLVLAMVLSIAFAAPVAAASKQHPCYGEKEKQLARVLLETVPLLGMSLDVQERVAKRTRYETCSAIALTGSVVDIDYAYAFFGDTRNRVIWLAAKRRNLDPLRVQAALVDLYWPPKTT